MNTQPIATARDADLRLSVIALQRAARRARELALQTGTAIVISRQGVIQTITPTSAVSESASSVQQSTALYGDNP